VSVSKAEIVIISFNCLEHLKNCIKSIKETSEIKITVVDNCSTDGTIEYLKSEDGVNYRLNDLNQGYGAAANQVLLNSDSQFYIVSNADVIYQEGAIDSLIKLISENTKIGVCGLQQIYPDGSWQRSYGDLPSYRLAIKDLLFVTILERIIRKKNWPNKLDDEIIEVEYIDGAVFCISKVAVELTMGFDKDYFFYTEEADLCKRVKEFGLKIVFTPHPRAIHLRGGSSGGNIISKSAADMLVNSKILYCKKHLDRGERNFFIRVEYLHNLIMKNIWGVISMLKPNSNEVKSKIEYYKLIVSSWKKGVKEIR